MKRSLILIPAILFFAGVVHAKSNKVPVPLNSEKIEVKRANISGYDPDREQSDIFVFERTAKTPNSVQITWTERSAGGYCENWDCPGISTTCENSEMKCTKWASLDETKRRRLCIHFINPAPLTEGQTEYFKFGVFLFSGLQLKSHQTHRSYKVVKDWDGKYIDRSCPAVDGGAYVDFVLIGR